MYILTKPLLYIYRAHSSPSVDRVQRLVLGLAVGHYQGGLGHPTRHFPRQDSWVAREGPSQGRLSQAKKKEQIKKEPGQDPAHPNSARAVCACVFKRGLYCHFLLTNTNKYEGVYK